MHQQQTIIGQYRFCERYCLGQGAFGKVYKGSRIPDGQQVAIKQIDISNAQDKAVLNEIELLGKLQHSNVVRYYDAVRSNHNFYIMTEYCSGGDVSDLLESDSEAEGVNQQSALQMFFQVAQGFEYLKKHNIMHRDLKPANILIHKGVYKIADFGLAKFSDLGASVMSQSFVGSPIYMSPQVLSRNYYTYKCDVWSLGVIFYELLMGELPWKTNDSSQLLFKIMENPCPYENRKRQLSETSRAILDGTLKYLEKQRLNWTELLSLRKRRKRIFSSDKELMLTKANSLAEKTVQDVKKSPLQFQFDTFDYNSVQNDLFQYQREILKHINNQLYSVSDQIIKLSSKSCCQALMLTCSQYLKQGSVKRQQFIDCSTAFLKFSSQNMSSLLIEMDDLKQARQIICLLELIHDFIVIKQNTFEEYQRVFSNCNLNYKTINEYVATVLSKINTFIGK